MSNERAKILKMVADGTITPEEGEQLLGRLDSPAAGGEPAGSPPSGGLVVAENGGSNGNGNLPPLKFLRILVEGGDDTINVRVPLALIRTGIQLSTIVPLAASEHLADAGIDLSQFSQMDHEELMESLRELSVDVRSEDGDTIRVFCE